MWSIQNLSAVYVILASTFPISIMNVHWCHLVHCEVKMFTSQCTKWLWTLALLQAQLVKRGWRLNISPRRCLSDETNMFCFYIFNQWNHFLQTDVQNGKWLCVPNTSYATLNLKLSSFVVKPCQQATCKWLLSPQQIISTRKPWSPVIQNDRCWKTLSFGGTSENCSRTMK